MVAYPIYTLCSLCKSHPAVWFDHGPEDCDELNDYKECSHNPLCEDCQAYTLLLDTTE